MAGIISDAQANAVIDLLFGSSGATWYAALLTTEPAGDGTGGVEIPSAGSYARVSFTDNSTTWPAASGRQKKNGIAFTFSAPTADWSAAILGVAFYTASSGGTFKGYARFTSVVTILNGYPAFSIIINSLTIKETNTI